MTRSNLLHVLSLLSVCALLVFSETPTLAVNLTWDISGSAGVQGGSGTWDTTTANWTNDGGSSNAL